MCFLEKLLWLCGWNWDVIPDYAAVSPSCTQTQRNIYVEICEIQHRVAPGSGDVSCVCMPAVSQDQHHPETMLVLHKRFRGFHWCIFCNFFLNQQEDPIHPRTFLFWLRCANALQRQTVLPVNISEWPRLDHVKLEPLDPKLENIQSILQLWDQG